MISEKELVEMEQRPEREDVRPLIAEIRRLNAIISDMHVPEPIMVKRDGEYVEEGVPNRFGSPL